MALEPITKPDRKLKCMAMPTAMDSCSHVTDA